MIRGLQSRRLLDPTGVTLQQIEVLAMRKWALCFILAGITLPAFAANRITVEQLEQMLAVAKAKPDADVARQLSGLELTERLGTARLEQLKAEMPGEKSQQALLALADISAFLDQPAAELPATATPDRATQRRILSLTVDYLGKTLPMLPNLFAARDTMRFESRPSQFQEVLPEGNPLHEVAKSRVTVLYRDGREFVDAGADTDKKAQAPDMGLTTWGEFGPILGIVLIDAARSNLSWSHWELGAGGPQAVFQYSVPKEKSHYDVRFCCVAESFGFEISVLSQRVGYHGEISVDPESGTILRVTALADLDPGNPIPQANVAVEYGPVDFGGKTYFCPVRGIALAQAPDPKAFHGALALPASVTGAGSHPILEKASLATVAQAPRQAFLNDVAFRQFHLFRAESKLVTGGESEAASRPTVSTAAASAAPGGTNPPDIVRPSEGTAVDSSTLFPQPKAATAIASAAPPADLSRGTPPEPIVPEITVTGASGLPAAPALAPAGTDSSVTLRLNARLVDVPLVALDKKGRPITNLKPEDLEVYDEGRKVNLRSFVQANGASVPPAQPTSSEPTTEPSQPSAAHAYSNREVGPVKSAGRDQQGNTIILLIDNTISFDDLSNVREQMRTFLNGLHENERIALYVMRNGGVKVLQDSTTDHALVATTLAKWIPSAQDVSLGQEQEARNRQTMDYVRNTEDLLSVNGHQDLDTTGNTQSLDPKLRTLGDNPGRDALSGLAILARHLAAIPGHKSLIWIASDNVLADWTYGSLNIDKGDRIIESSILHAQEAMNDAHVSVYPLDASRLEAGGIDASIGTRNVALNPAATANQINAGCGTPSMIGHGVQPPTEETAGADITTCQKDLNPGRMMAQMQQDSHPIQGAYRELADATGGRPFRRASDIVSEFNSVVADGRATYLLSFTPALVADGKYHRITVKIPSRKDINLRYRTGFFYRAEPTSIQDRFRDAVLEPEEATQIALTADPLPGSNGRSVKLGIAATDLEIAQSDAFWTDKLDVFVVQREVSGTKAHVTGQTLGLRLKSASYQKYLREGIPFNQAVEAGPGVGSVRIVVLDENSGRMGSVTVPAAAIGTKQ
jgi:VWFA-related protein